MPKPISLSDLTIVNISEASLLNIVGWGQYRMISWPNGSSRALQSEGCEFDSHKRPLVIDIYQRP
jgi:hypothetical protein